MEATATTQEGTLYARQLPNGLQMLGQRMPDVESAAAIFWVNTGTRDEEPRLMGVSHFLEHMAFKRTEHYTSQEIDRLFEQMGADHNAATSREMTFYWARVLGESVDPAIQILSELTHPVLDKEDFDQERNVILEEIARSEDQPIHVLFTKFLHDYFGDHPLALEILGTPETIKALDVEEMRDYWAKRYGTKNILFAIAGNFDWESIVGQIEGLSRGWEPGETGRKREPAPFKPGLHVEKRDQFAQEQIAIAVPSVDRNDPRYYAAAVLSTILGDDRGSRLYWSVYQTGLAETVSAEVMEFEDNGMMFVHLATEPKLAADALRVVREQLERIQQFDIQPEELQRAKTKLKASVIIGGESTNDRVMGLINSWLTLGRLETLEEMSDKIDAVRLEDIRSLLQEFPLGPDQLITAVGPLTDVDLAAAIH
jgi:predicted Zn-dependent peptidase